MRVGPEPTTDRFMAVVHGPDDKTVPGNALTVAPGSPFGGLKYYGNNFLTRFEGAQVNSPILERLTLVDTPGVLSGEKQRLSRNYDFDQIVRWFAERVDMIVLLFDPFKLDVSDELAAIIKSLAGNEDKIRCVLNKADGLGYEEVSGMKLRPPSPSGACSTRPTRSRSSTSCACTARSCGRSAR